MKIEFDREVGALYLRFHTGRVARTVELAEDIYLDVDHDGQVLGAEFVDVSDLVALLDRHDGTIEIPERVTDPIPA